MKEFRSKLAEDGRMVIPAIYRKALHLEPGEELIVRMSKDELHVLSAKQSLKNAQHRVQKLAQGVSLVEKIKSMRQEDNSHG